MDSLSPLKKKKKTESKQSIGSSSAAMSTSDIDGPPPGWFRAYEARQIERMDNMAAKWESLKIDVDKVSDKVEKLSLALVKAEERIDDLENRSRRNNLVIYNLKEDKEEEAGSSSTVKVVKRLLREAKLDIDLEGCTSRVHRTPTHRREARDRNQSTHQRPRPVHVGFNTYREKERVRKELIRFLSSTDGRPMKVYISNDYSKRVLDQRKAQMAEFKALKERGLKPFFLFPAILKAKDSSGRIVSQTVPPGAAGQQV